MLWDLKEGKRLYSLDAGDIIHSLVFSPNRYWLCAATTAGIKVGRRGERGLVALTAVNAFFLFVEGHLGLTRSEISNCLGGAPRGLRVSKLESVFVSARISTTSKGTREREAHQLPVL